MMHRLHFIFFLFFPCLLSAQQKFQGEFNYNGLQGIASFQLVPGKDGRGVKQGRFEFVRKEQDKVDKTILYRSLISGNYREDLKTGNWEYLDERHQVTLEDVVDFRLKSSLNSTQIKLSAQYRGGLPHGKWVFEENAYVDGELKPKSMAEEFQFNDGDIRGKFQYKTFRNGKTHFIRGELLDGGIMNGEWTLVYEQDSILISEVRNYMDGFLLGLVKRDLLKNEVWEEVVFYETIEKLNADKRGESQGFRVSDISFGLQFNDGFLEKAKPVVAQESGNRFIGDFLTSVLRYDEHFVNQNGELIDYPIHTKRFVFELSRADQRIVEELPARFDRLRQLVNDYASRNALTLNNQKSDSLAQAYSFFQFQQKKMAGMGEVIDLLRSKSIQFYDVENLLSGDLAFLTEADTIQYNFNQIAKARVIAYQFGDMRAAFFAGLSSYVDQMDQKIRIFKEYTDQSLSEIEQDEDLRAIEQQVIDRRQELLSLYDSLDGLSEGSKHLLQTVASNILDLGFGSLSEKFAKETSFGGKKEVSRAMFDLFDEAESQFEPLAQINKKFNLLDSLFLEEIFNPFTYTKYDQRVKNRLYMAGGNLLSHYVTQIMDEKDYAKLKYWTSRINLLMGRMTVLRNEDTRKLERRLRRNLPMEKVESMLELQKEP